MYHFIGIAGAGMASLAHIMYKLGDKVKGSDVSKDFFTTEKLKEDVEISLFSEDNIYEGLIIVQGNSFNEENNVEVKKAKELNLKIYTYQEMVAKLSERFKTISVSGTHGKTTTSALLSHVLKNIVGANYLIGDGTGYADKDNEYFVLEACEYKRHFLDYTQEYSIITNIDLDHVDYYKDINDVLDAFSEFAKRTKKNVILCGDDQNVRKLKGDNFIYYGINDNNFIQARNIKYEEKGTTFSVYIDNKYYNKYFITYSGQHMVLNSLAVISVCYLENIDKNKVKKYLSTFKGAKRRFAEEKINNNIIIDDYAHHPVEIKVTIEAVRQKYPDKKIISIFQPHTFSRIKMFKEEIATELNKSDKVFVLPIHQAREKQEDFKDISSDIVLSLLKNGSPITMDDASPLIAYENSVLLFLSPNSLKELIDNYKDKVK